MNAHVFPTFETEQYESYKCVCISTAHISKADAQMLSDAVLFDLPKSNMILSRDTGFFIKLYAVEEYNQHRTFSNALNNVISWAFNKGFGMIELDCDGPIINELPRFHW